MLQWKERARASGLHLAISLCIAAAAALLVFAVWYPYPYREVSGGRELFLLVTTVDVILGPLITLAIFNRAKPRRLLLLDFSVVACIQLAALAYGLWTVAAARPVHLVFEFDRVRVVHAIDIPDELRPQTPAGIQADPWSGPTLLAVRPFRDAKEGFEATVQALDGTPLGARPDLWQPYEAARQRVTAAARPVEQLRKLKPAQAGLIDVALRKAGRDAANTLYLPMVSRAFFWTALLDPRSAEIVGFVPLDPY
ncbi:TfpX/TfpZ family type IV pilin accessory protein [Ramlibacter tataouinensis]|uniref:Pilus assembly protein n=1 Tax=Ramlibacter tataouinensis TaxID=94132 RepID=A0A127JT80_9BURK|nr:TfpX/TfpZ family type IV pilin accessory protein [Ramlibacter tataouinensis]AMO23119.1 pilus assembly protein [Ramlibacter tataouinensis]